MKISDELIACYVEGTVTAEELDFVRRYLCEHPEEYERILCLIDNDTADYLGEQLEISNNCISMDKSSFSDIAYKSVRKHREYGHPAYKSLNYKNRGIFLSYALRYYVKPKKRPGSLEASGPVIVLSRQCHSAG